MSRARVLTTLLLLLPSLPLAQAARSAPPSGARRASLGVVSELTGTFVPSAKVALDGRWLAYLADETVHGDRNGDGDALDRVLAVRDLARGVETNLALAVVDTNEETRAFLLEGDVLLALVSEPGQGGLDRNGDGDALDGVLAAVDLASGRVTNLALAGSAPSFELAQGVAVLLVPEAAQGADLDGNGILAQAVPFAWRAADGSLTNLGLAAFSAGAAGGRVWLEASELDADRNGDGDQADRVLHVWDPVSGALTNTGYATYSSGAFVPPARPVASEEVVVWLVGEAQQGATDLDGDGDALDRVPFVHRFATGVTTGVGLAAPDPGVLAPPRADGEHVLFVVSEAAQGALDRNGDGDALDQVAHVFDAASGVVTNSGLQATTLALAEPWAVLLVHESEQGGLDRNGDGDALDHVPALLDVRTGASIVLSHAAQGGEAVLGLPANPPLVAGGLVLFAVQEAADGAQDHNGDGDANDRVAFAFRAETGELEDLGLAIPLLDRAFATDGARALVVVSEAGQGVDLDGDGDLADAVAQAWLPGAPARNLRLALAPSQVRVPLWLEGGAVVSLLAFGPGLGQLALTRFLAPAAVR